MSQINHDLNDLAITADGYGEGQMNQRIGEIQAQIDLLEEGEEKDALQEQINEVYRAWNFDI